MNNKFKVGDKVRCIDTDATDNLELNKIYTVTRVSPYYIDVDNDGGYYPSRFELVEEQNEIKQMKHLKIGNKVRYVRNIGPFWVGGPLVLGSVYTVKSLVVPNSPTSDVRLVEMGDHSCYSQRRFELVEEQNEIKQMNKNPAAIWIYVKNNTVSEFIQKLALTNGFKWNSGSKDVATNSFYDYILLSFDAQWGRKIMCWDRKSATNTYKYDIYDAVKDLPKIMELLETPSMPLPVVNGYTMSEYKKDRLTVKFGCAEISVGFLRDVLRIMNSSYEGNRKLEKITLNSGVILSKTDVENIFKYIEFVNKK